MPFFINFKIPTLDTEVKLKEVSFKTFKTINKFLINQNNNHINEFFDEILMECLVEKDIFYKLTNFDKFCALFLLRCTSISPTIEYTDKGINVKKALLPFLNKCLDFKTNFSKQIHLDSYEIMLNLPDTLFFNDIFDAFYSCIHKVYIKNSEIDFKSVNKAGFIDNLPAEVTSRIKEYSDSIKTDFSKLVFDVLANESDNKLTLSPFDLSFFEILKALYTSNLKNIFELQYILVSKLNYSADYVDNSTLTENLILCNIYEQEMQKLKEEQENIDKTVPLNK
jgi:hypothetical protein